MFTETRSVFVCAHLHVYSDNYNVYHLGYKVMLSYLMNVMFVFQRTCTHIEEGRMGTLGRRRGWRRLGRRRGGWGKLVNVFRSFELITYVDENM